MNVTVTIVKNAVAVTVVQGGITVAVEKAQTVVVTTLIQSSPPQDKYYRHLQMVASALWTITHNLGKRPSISVVDTAGDECIGDVQYINDNIVTVAFSAPFGGEAYCN